MDKQQKILAFIQKHKLAVIATVNEHQLPEAAVVGFGVTEHLEIIFDTVSTSRKYQNITHEPQVALVIGWDEEITVQYEGKATQLAGKALEHYQPYYFQTYPEGRERQTWEGIVYIKVSPQWIRYSDFNTTPPDIFEVTLQVQ